jgi:hypothetical protein
VRRSQFTAPAQITPLPRLCSKCRSTMALVRLEPDIPDHDKRTFECRECGQEEIAVVRFRESAES